VRKKAETEKERAYCRRTEAQAADEDEEGSRAKLAEEGKLKELADVKRRRQPTRLPKPSKRRPVRRR